MLAYDTNILVYALEEHPEFSAAARRIVLRGVSEGAVLSTVLVQEILTGYASQNEERYKRAQHAMSALENVTFQPVTLEIAMKAASLTRQYGKKINGYDALHVASALESGVDIFYTNDKQLLQIDAIHTLRIESMFN